MSAKPVLKAYLCHAPYCMYSEQFVDFADEMGFELSIHDVSLNGIPSFLAGTPTILLEDGSIYCGDSAFQYVHENAKLVPDQELRITAPERSKTTASGIPTSVFEGMSFPPSNRTNTHVPPSRDDILSKPPQGAAQQYQPPPAQQYQPPPAQKPIFAAANEAETLGGSLFTNTAALPQSAPAAHAQTNSIFGTKVEKPNKKKNIDVDSLMAERSNTIRLV
jgi:hypothetical protein